MSGCPSRWMIRPSTVSLSAVSCNNPFRAASVIMVLIVFKRSAIFDMIAGSFLLTGSFPEKCQPVQRFCKQYVFYTECTIEQKKDVLCLIVRHSLYIVAYDREHI